MTNADISGSTVRRSWKSTIGACYLGNVVQAAVVNVTPIIFIPLKDIFGLSYTDLGILVLINFVTQVIMDIGFSRIVDRHGFRRFVVAGHILCAVGFFLFGASVLLFPTSIFTGLIIGTIFSSAGGGLLELLLSPIIHAIPSEGEDVARGKARAMSLLHSFYAWGSAAVVLITTLLIFLLGRENWPIIVVLWGILPTINIFLFCRVPLAEVPHESTLQKLRQWVFSPIFVIAFMAILFGGASEVSMAQWTSPFIEKGLRLPKLLGDVMGSMVFALLLGTGRVLNSMFAHKLDTGKVLIFGSVGAVFCYWIAAFAPVSMPAMSLAACALCGLFTSMLWPGTLVMAANKLPYAGTALFALLSAGGDIGCSIGPWFTGKVVDLLPHFNLRITAITPEQVGLRGGMLAASIFPILSIIFQLSLRKIHRKEVVNEH